MSIDFTAIFKEEVTSQMQRITELALSLENAGEQAEQEVQILNDLMREFHTIKGAARAVNYDDIKQLAHAIEDIYHAILENQASVILPDLTDLSLFAVDMIENLLRARAEGTEFTVHECLPQLAKDYLAGHTITIPITIPIPSKISSDEKNAEQSVDEISFTHKVIDNGEASNTKDNVIDLNTEQKTKIKNNDYENLTDSLMTLSGEFSISIDAFSSQRLRVNRLSEQINNLQRDLSKVMSNLAEPMYAAGLQNGNDRLASISERLDDINKQQCQINDNYDQADINLNFLSNDLNEKVNKARMIPLSQLTDSFPRLIRDLATELNKEVRFSCQGENARLDRGIIEIIRAPMLHVLRNAVDHGIETASVREQKGKNRSGHISVDIQSLGSQVNIIIKDDGKGMDLDVIKQKVLSRGDTTEAVWDTLDHHEKLQFLFLPGFSTSETITETSGRGFGMDIVKTDIEKVGGRVDVGFEKDKGMQLSLSLPLNLSLMRCLMVKAGSDSFLGNQYVMFPLNDIEDVRNVGESEIQKIEGRDTVTIKGESVLVHDLSQLMQLKTSHKNYRNRQLIYLKKDDLHCALVVDEIIDERDIVTRAFDSRIGKVKNFQSISMTSDGGVALVVDVTDMILSAVESSQTSHIQQTADNKASDDKTHVLIVEDSVTVREVEKHMLQEAGYQVTTAVDGLDGLNKLRSGQFNLIISDIDMPRMNGIEMIKKIRSNDKYKNMPIIVVSYKDRDEDRNKGMDAGANHYVTKSAFDSGEMIEKIAGLTA